MKPLPLAIVTGGGRGIGRAVAVRLAAHGHDVAICGLEADEVERVADEVRAVGRRSVASVVDVGDPAEVDAFFAHVRTKLGEVDVLVNNAGTIRLPDDVASATVDRWDATFDVNARAAYQLCSLALPSMIARNHGRVVNVASTAGLAGLRGRIAYSASKHAVVGLTRSLAEEVDALGVTVNAVCPGAVRTRLTEGSRPDADRYGWLLAEDVARTIAHLVGNDAGHVHGAIIELRDRSLR